MTENTNTTQQVFQTIKNRIISTFYAPGTIVNETDIADEFNISRTPVREIFKRLEFEKYLVIIPRVGAQVAVLDFKFIKECFEMKIVLEEYCASLAASANGVDDEIAILEGIIERFKKYLGTTDYSEIIQDDELFHVTIRKMAGNQLIEEVLDTYQGHLKRLWYLQANKVKDIDIFIVTLNDILEAVKKHDPIQAQQAAKEHIHAYLNQVKSELF